MVRRRRALIKFEPVRVLCVGLPLNVYEKSTSACTSLYPLSGVRSLPGLPGIAARSAALSPYGRGVSAARSLAVFFEYNMVNGHARYDGGGDSSSEERETPRSVVKFSLNEIVEMRSYQLAGELVWCDGKVVKVIGGARDDKSLDEYDVKVVATGKTERLRSGPYLRKKNK